MEESAKWMPDYSFFFLLCLQSRYVRYHFGSGQTPVGYHGVRNKNMLQALAPCSLPHTSARVAHFHEHIRAHMDAHVHPRRFVVHGSKIHSGSMNNTKRGALARPALHPPVLDFQAPSAVRILFSRNPLTLIFSFSSNARFSWGEKKRNGVFGLQQPRTAHSTKQNGSRIRERSSFFYYIYFT